MAGRGNAILNGEMSDDQGINSKPTIVSSADLQRSRLIPYNQVARQNNFFNRANESPIQSAGNQIVRGSASNGVSAANLPALAKQSAGNSANDNTRDTINPQEISRRSSQGFNTRQAKLGDPDFDYSGLNLNLR